MENNQLKYHDLFPTPVGSITIPETFSNILPFFMGQEMLTDKDGVNGKEYGERSKNSYILNEPECKEFKNHLLEYILSFSKTIGFEYDSYKFSQSWVSIKQPGQYHHIHSHPNSIISGVFYFGPGDEKTSCINFHKNSFPNNTPHIQISTSLTKYSNDLITFDFVPGNLLIFPSHLQHSVPLNETNMPRWSLAFNVVPTYGLGDEMSLTELKF